MTWTRADFLAWEERQEERHEFVAGIVSAVPGGAWAHNSIAGNMLGMLHGPLRGTECAVVAHNLKLAPPATDDVMYPDLLVVCGKVPANASSVAHATVIVEVLSKSSRKRDTEKKWASYRTIAELRHYLVVEQETALVTMYSRESEDAPWIETETEGLRGRVALDAIGVKLPMARIYENVDLSEA